jgi:hypothetical protein
VHGANPTHGNIVHTFAVQPSYFVQMRVEAKSDVEQPKG